MKVYFQIDVVFNLFSKDIKIIKKYIHENFYGTQNKKNKSEKSTNDNTKKR